MYGKIDAGEFAAFILYIGMFMTPIQRFVTLFEQLQEGMAGFGRFYEIMNTEGETDEGEIELDTIKGDIEFKNVSFGYDTEDKRMVISNLNLKLDAGKTLALVGPSGGGKSTLCHLLPRFYNVTSGEITIDGNSICDVTLRSLRKNIGIVSQTVFLFDGTVRENIAYGTDNATDEEILEALGIAQAKSVVEDKGGLDAIIEQGGKNLSGGQRQRLTIARALTKKPKILILDDSASALDFATDAKLRAAIKNIKDNTTVFIVSQRASSIMYADTIIVLDDGEAVGIGAHEQLLKDCAVYREIYASQFSEEEVAR